MDNRGTRAPRGREWRKSIYGAVGVLGLDPIVNGQLTTEEVARCAADTKARRPGGSKKPRKKPARIKGRTRRIPSRAVRGSRPKMD
ncbi:DUF1013 domain-containing protein [Candidatus Sumerlaeota bacterium]|nr:DUF1013 domain-containing protein [Candidatus Sumerlaeota bacterium]